MHVVSRVLRAGLIVLGVIVGLFLVLLLYLWASGRIWYPRQRARVAALVEQVTSDVSVDDAGVSEDDAQSRTAEDQFAVSPLRDGLPLNSIRMIATHNSYHLEPDWIRRMLIGLVEPEEPSRLRYTHETLWDQLEEGVRSFELDVRARRNRFTITHVPLVDSRGPNPDFALALKEIVAWSDWRPGHVPIIVLLELKSDWMFLDPGLKDWDADALSRLDAVVESTVPAGQLLTPKMVGRGAESLVDAVRLLGWPTLGETRGRIMFVVHTDDRVDPLYVAGDPTLASRPMFTSRSPTGTDRVDAVFVIHNDPDAESIAALTAMNLLVRTRSDGDGSFTAAQRAAALDSSAQIISTDLPPGHQNDPGLGVVEFAVGKTLLQTSGY